jgi:hypothetical protein
MRPGCFHGCRCHYRILLLANVVILQIGKGKAASVQIQNKKISGVQKRWSRCTGSRGRGGGASPVWVVGGGNMSQARGEAEEKRRRLEGRHRRNVISSLRRG